MFRIKLWLCLAILPITLFSQKNNITGYILDHTDKSPLVGANILIPALSKGAATGQDGRFIITGVKKGDYNLSISYIGYESKEVSVKVSDGIEELGDIYLKPKVLQSQSVVVSAQAKGQLSAINQEIQSKTVKNIVSSQRIREFPDNSAAKAVSRLPGISLQGDDKVVVRGVESKLNKIQINGIDLPSTGLEDRSVSMGFISSNMLSSIELSKVLTPDMGADAAGGVVNMKLREAPEGFQSDFMVQGNGNLQEKTFGNYRIWGSLSHRFFDSNVGVFIQGNANKTDNASDVSNIGYHRLPGQEDPGYGNATYVMSNTMGLQKRINKSDKFGGSLILDYKYSNGKIIIHNMYSHQENDNVTFNDAIGISRTYRTYRDKHTKTLYTNALQGEHSSWGLDIDYSLSNAFSNRETDLLYDMPFSSGTSAMDPLTASEVKKMKPKDFFDLEMYGDDYKKAYVSYGFTDYGDYEEKPVSGNLNIKHDYALTNNISGFLKIGGEYKYRYRETDKERLRADLGGKSSLFNEPAGDFLEDIGAEPSEPLAFEDFRNENFERGDDFFIGKWDFNQAADIDKLDEFVTLSSPTWWRTFAQSHKDDYSGDEHLKSGYIMGEISLYDKLTIITGARYEQMKTDYKAFFTVKTHNETGYNPDTLTVIRENDHWFPNLNIEYQFTDWLDLKIALTKSIMRPDYKMFLPNIFADVSGGTYSGQKGNPALKPAKSKNLDIHLSAYSGKLGLLTVGGFYKEIGDMFYGKTTLYKNLPKEYQWTDVIENFAESAKIATYINNPYDAYVKGLEFSWQTNFRYLPQPFSYFVLNVNYSHMWSKSKYPQFMQKSIRVDDGGLIPKFETVEIDTSRTGRLIHQGNDIANLAVGYDYKGLSARVSFAFQGNVLGSLGGRPESDSFTENRYKWDFTIKQKLPIKGLQLFLNGVNITNSPYQTYQRFYFNNEEASKKTNHINHCRYSGGVIQLGLRYRF